MRDMTPEMASKIDGPSVVVDQIMLMEGLFPSEALRFWSGKGLLPHDGKLWTGSGDLIRISETEETTEERATGYTITLAGVKPDSIDRVMRERVEGSVVTVWYALVEYAPGQMNIVDDPLVLFTGFAAALKINDDDGSPEILLDVEHPIRNLGRTNRHLYTDERQKKDHPNDRGFEEVAAIRHRGGLPWGQS